MNRKRFPQPARFDHGTKYRVVRRMKHRVGHPNQHHRAKHPRIHRKQPDRHVRPATQHQPGHQHAPRAETIHRIPHRRLHQPADDVEKCDRQTKLDEINAQPGPQHRKKRDQHKVIEVADQMRRADQRQRPDLGSLQSRVHWSLCARRGFGTVPITSAAASRPRSACDSPNRPPRIAPLSCPSVGAARRTRYASGPSRNTEDDCQCVPMNGRSIRHQNPRATRCGSSTSASGVRTTPAATPCACRTRIASSASRPMVHSPIASSSAASRSRRSPAVKRAKSGLPSTAQTAPHIASFTTETTIHASSPAQRKQPEGTYTGCRLPSLWKTPPRADC